MRALAMVLIACSSGPTTPPTRPERHVATTPPSPDAPMIQSTHASDIRTLAISEDGLAALSVDDAGKLRLWPALDGSREPVRIAAPEPRHIALDRDGEGFAIAIVDPAGTLALLRMSAAGGMRARTQVTSDAMFGDLTASSAGVLALRSDGLLDVYAASGTLVARLAPIRDERIHAVLYRRGRALALVDSQTTRMHGRWLELDHGVRWGADTPELAIEPASAVLSPDHLHVAGSTVDDHGMHEVVMVDVATGVALPLGGGHGQVIGFVETDVVAVGLSTTVNFFDHTGAAVPDAEIAMPLVNEGGDLVDGVRLGRAGDHRLIGAYNVQLAVVGAGAVAFLGYHLPLASRLEVGPGGVGLGHGMPRLLVDAALHTRKLLDHLPAPERAAPAKWIDVLPLDDHHAIALAESELRHRWIEVIDLDTGKQVQRVPDEVDDDRVNYEPATHLLATTGARFVRLQRLDPETTRFGPPMILPVCAGFSEVTLVDPALADGMVAAVRCELAVAEIRAEDLGPVIAPRPMRPFTGEYVAVDRAGHVYLEDDPVITALDRELAIGKVGRAVRPSPDGKLIAAYTASRLSLSDAAGHIRWTVALAGIDDARWAGDALLVLAQGLARVDLSDGHFAAKQCGWQFGRWPLPLEAEDNEHPVEPLCDGP